MSAEIFLKGRVQLCCGDSLHFLRDQPVERFDSIVTDPPYALVSIVKRFGEATAVPAKGNEAFMRASRGFMGKQWDTGETAFDPAFWAECLRVLKPGGHVVAFGGTRTYHRLACAIEDAGFEIRDSLQWLYGSGFPKSHNAGNGWGTALKPACEPICLARKPLIGTVAQNVLAHGTGAINVDGCRISHDEPTKTTERTAPRYSGVTMNGGKIGGEQSTIASADPAGRWPANVVHDGSEEVLAAFPETTSIGHAPKNSGGIGGVNGIYGGAKGREQEEKWLDDRGSAARFFYTAKADADDRLGSKHPTVKPLDLMQWLVRLVTPPGGLVLDPFAGTGTTAEACYREGMRCMLVERESEYQADIRRRMALILAGPVTRTHESVKAKTKNMPIDCGPLFAVKAEAAE